MVDESHESGASGAPAPLEAALRGSLPCINCTYELQGLSIRGNCPECGLAVRATILYRVDPHAEAFQPLPTPRFTAWGVALWPTGGLLAVLFAWIPRLTDIAADWLGWASRPHVVWASWASLMALGVSFIGALGIIHPTRGTSARLCVAAIVGAVAYIPLAICWWRIDFVIDTAALAPYVQAGPNSDRIALRLCLGASALALMLSLRPAARQLVARSLVLRTGRVDRQTIYATSAAIVIAMMGDSVRLASTLLPEVNRPLVAGAGTILVLVGSVLTTMAMAGGAIDGWRIRRAILTPSPSLGQLIEFRPANGA